MLPYPSHKEPGACCKEPEACCAAMIQLSETLVAGHETCRAVCKALPDWPLSAAPDKRKLLEIVFPGPDFSEYSFVVR